MDCELPGVQGLVAARLALSKLAVGQSLDGQELTFAGNFRSADLAAQPTSTVTCTSSLPVQLRRCPARVGWKVRDAFAIQVIRVHCERLILKKYSFPSRVHL